MLYALEETAPKSRTEYVPSEEVSRGRAAERRQSIASARPDGRRTPAVSRGDRSGGEPKSLGGARRSPLRELRLVSEIGVR